jgi:hypothetical protein
MSLYLELQASDHRIFPSVKSIMHASVIDNVVDNEADASPEEFASDRALTASLS